MFVGPQNNVTHFFRHACMHHYPNIPNTFWVVFMQWSVWWDQSNNDEEKQKLPDVCWLFILNFDFYIIATYCIFFWDSPLKCVFFFNWHGPPYLKLTEGRGPWTQSQKWERAGFDPTVESFLRRRDEEARAGNATSQASMASKRAGKQLDLRVFFRTKDTGEKLARIKSLSRQLNMHEKDATDEPSMWTQHAVRGYSSISVKFMSLWSKSSSISFSVCVGCHSCVLVVVAGKMNQKKKKKKDVILNHSESTTTQNSMRIPSYLFCPVFFF